MSVALKKTARQDIPEGYIALISVIVISTLLLALSLTLATSSFYGRFNVLSSEYKERSAALAEACVNTALVNLATNQAYVPAGGGDIIPIGSDSCTIFSVATVSGQFIIKSTATFQQAVTNYVVAAQVSDLQVVSWEEAATLP